MSSWVACSAFESTDAPAPTADAASVDGSSSTPDASSVDVRKDPQVVWVRELLLDGADAGGVGGALSLRGFDAIVLSSGHGALGATVSTEEDALLVSLRKTDGTIAEANALGGGGAQSGISLLVDPQQRFFVSWLQQGSNTNWSSSVQRRDVSSPIHTVDPRGRDFIRTLATWSDGVFYAGETTNNSGSDPPYAFYGAITTTPLQTFASSPKSTISSAVSIGPGVVIAGHFWSDLTLDGCPKITAETPNIDTVFVARLGPDMKCVWSVPFPATGNGQVGAIALGSDGNVVLGGTFVGTFLDAGSAPFALWFAKMSPNDGHLLWTKTFPALTGSADVRALDVDLAGSIHTTGWLRGVFNLRDQAVQPDGEKNAYLLSLDSAGEVIRAVRYGSGDVRGYGVRVDADGAIYLSGDIQVGSRLGLPGTSDRQDISRTFVMKLSP